MYFCFLNDYDRSRVAQIPKEVFEPEETILLDLEIGGEAIAI